MRSLKGIVIIFLLLAFALHCVAWVGLIMVRPRVPVNVCHYLLYAGVSFTWWGSGICTWSWWNV